MNAFLVVAEFSAGDFPVGLFETYEQAVERSLNDDHERDNGMLLYGFHVVKFIDGVPVKFDALSWFPAKRNEPAAASREDLDHIPLDDDIPF
jgi:hypothetical protein